MREWRATADDGRQVELFLPGVAPSLAGSETVEYRTVLSDPRDPADDVAVLTPRGLYARAEVKERLGGDGPVLVLNDTARAVTGTLRWRAGDTGGSLDVSAGGGERWRGGPVTIPASAGRIELELVGETVHAENSYEL